MSMSNFFDFLTQIDNELDRAIRKGLYGDEVCSARDFFTRKTILRFNSGKSVAISDNSLHRSTDVAERIRAEIGSIEGCRMQLDSFATIEANESCLYMDDDHGND